MQRADNVVLFRRPLSKIALPDEPVFEFGGSVPDEDDEHDREAQVVALVARFMDQGAAFTFAA